MCGGRGWGNACLAVTRREGEKHRGGRESPIFVLLAAVKPPPFPLRIPPFSALKIRNCMSTTTYVHGVFLFIRSRPAGGVSRDFIKKESTTWNGNEPCTAGRSPRSFLYVIHSSVRRLSFFFTRYVYQRHSFKRCCVLCVRACMYHACFNACLHMCIYCINQKNLALNARYPSRRCEA